MATVGPRARSLCRDAESFIAGGPNHRRSHYIIRASRFRQSQNTGIQVLASDACVDVIVATTRTVRKSDSKPVTGQAYQAPQSRNRQTTSNRRPEYLVSRSISRSPQMVAGVQKPPGVLALGVSSARQAPAWPSILPVDP